MPVYKILVICCGAAVNVNGNRYIMYIKQCVNSLSSSPNYYSERDNSETWIFRPKGFLNAVWNKMLSVLQDLFNFIIHFKIRQSPKTAILSSSDTRWGGLTPQLWTENLLIIIRPSLHYCFAWNLSAAAEGGAPKPQSSEAQTSHQDRNPCYFQSIISMLSTQEQGEKLGFSQNNQKD